MAFMDVPLWSSAKTGKDAFGFRGTRAVDDNHGLHKGHAAAWLLLEFPSDAAAKADALSQHAQYQRDCVPKESMYDEAASPDGFKDSFCEQDGEDDCEENSDDHGVFFRLLHQFFCSPVAPAERRGRVYFFRWVFRFSRMERLMIAGHPVLRFRRHQRCEVLVLRAIR